MFLISWRFWVCPRKPCGKDRWRWRKHPDRCKSTLRGQSWCRWSVGSLKANENRVNSWWKTRQVLTIYWNQMLVTLTHWTLVTLDAHFCSALIFIQCFYIFSFCFALLDPTKRQQGCCVAKFYFNKAKASKRERDEKTVGTPTIQRQAAAANSQSETYVRVNKEFN